MAKKPQAGATEEYLVVASITNDKTNEYFKPGEIVKLSKVWDISGLLKIGAIEKTDVITPTGK